MPNTNNNTNKNNVNTNNNKQIVNVILHQYKKKRKAKKQPSDQPTKEELDEQVQQYERSEQPFIINNNLASQAPHPSFETLHKHHTDQAYSHLVNNLQADRNDIFDRMRQLENLGDSRYTDMLNQIDNHYNDIITHYSNMMNTNPVPPNQTAGSYPRGVHVSETNTDVHNINPEPVVRQRAPLSESDTQDIFQMDPKPKTQLSEHEHEATNINPQPNTTPGEPLSETETHQTFKMDKKPKPQLSEHVHETTNINPQPNTTPGEPLSETETNTTFKMNKKRKPQLSENVHEAVNINPQPNTTPREPLSETETHTAHRSNAPQTEREILEEELRNIPEPDLPEHDPDLDSLPVTPVRQPTAVNEQMEITPTPKKRPDYTDRDVITQRIKQRFKAMTPQQKESLNDEVRRIIDYEDFDELDDNQLHEVLNNIEALYNNMSTPDLRQVAEGIIRSDGSNMTPPLHTTQGISTPSPAQSKKAHPAHDFFSNANYQDLKEMGIKFRKKNYDVRKMNVDETDEIKSYLASMYTVVITHLANDKDKASFEYEYNRKDKGDYKKKFETITKYMTNDEYKYKK